ncbi:MAG: 2-polyprenyl-3-methyl-5-hydroxy-6-metoxy-1,4-benzoquinol methylase [Paraglaciecola sp.]|jgi:2-polyprenyl-3-methyl-5-hydroxy-6-metoxy-1,4-benzoquinol methylase
MTSNKPPNQDIYKELKKNLKGANSQKKPMEIIPADWDPLLTDATLSGWFNQDTQELFTDFPVGNDDSTLDVGSGDGAYSHFCAKLGANVTLADVDEENLAQAYLRVQTVTKKDVTKILLNQDEKIPVADNSFSRVICLEVMEHLDSPSDFLKDLVRLGKYGSLYLLSVPAPEIEKLQKQAAPTDLFEKPNHIQVFGRNEFKSLVEDAGLKVIRQEYNGFFWSIWWMLFWSVETDLSNSAPEITDKWTEIWSQLLRTQPGEKIKKQLDELLPKSQIIVAQKPFKHIAVP